METKSENLITIEHQQIQEDASLDELETLLCSELEDGLQDLAGLEEDYKKIGSPESLGGTIMNVVWEQFVNQVGVVAGEDFIKENSGRNLDLRDSAHIQTTENFAKGKIATHNDEIDYRERHYKWQQKFQRNEKGEIEYSYDRIDGENKAKLAKGARDYIDKGRPKGSASMHKDHTVSAGEIIRDAEANAHLTPEGQAAFANSHTNLNLLDSSANESKSDHKMINWLESERNGEKPADRFNIDENKLREKDEEARNEYKRAKDEGKRQSEETGRKSQRAEAFRIGSSALKAAIMGLLAELIKNIIRKLVEWFRSKERKLSNLLDKLKEAIRAFIGNLKQNLLTAGNTAITAILTAIWGPIVGVLKKVWILLKQGHRSLKQAIDYVRTPENKSKPFSILMMEVGKIVIAGVTAGGAILLSEAIEKGLTTMPVFAFPIPLLGSLASILGMFFGAVICGIIGAIAMNLIDKTIAAKMRHINKIDQLNKANEIRQTQTKVDIVVAAKVERAKKEAAESYVRRHSEAKETLGNVAKSMKQSIESADKAHKETNKGLDEIFNTLNSL